MTDGFDTSDELQLLIPLGTHPRGLSRAKPNLTRSTPLVCQQKISFSLVPAFTLGAVTGSVVMKAQIKQRAEMIEASPALQTRLQMGAALERRYERRRGEWGKKGGREREALEWSQVPKVVYKYL